jgi:hypothetical protein
MRASVAPRNGAYYSLGAAERSAARLAHQSGGLGVASSNLAAPTNKNTLADVRNLLGHLPAGNRVRSPWQLAAERDKEAAGADPADVWIALRMALMLEGVEHRYQ